ncbi:MAG: porin [Rhodospirillaceae bacterium]|nr:porin [Rhodospirillaceae bacterium]
MKSALLKGLLSGGAAICALSTALPALAQEDLDSLRKRLEAVTSEVKTLKDRIATHEADMAAKRRRVAAAAAVEAGDKPRSWKLPGTNTSLRIGGRIYFHSTWDLDGGGANNGSRGSNVSSAFSETSTGNAANNGGHWTFTSRYSRIFLQTFTPTDWGDLTTYIETDFNPSQGELLRLRYAYGTLGPILAGQADSQFRAAFTEGDPMDINGPPGSMGSRTSQLRYTHNFGSGLTLGLAIEAPSDSILRGGSPAGQRFPEGTAALSYSFPSGRLYVAGLFKQIEHDTGAGNAHDKAFGWGALVAAEYNVTKRFWIAGQGYVGQGTAGSAGGVAQAGFSDAILINANRIEPIFYYGGFGTAEFRLTDTLRIRGLAGIALQDVDGEINKSLIASGTSHYVWGAEGNLEWYPVPGARFGIGYHYSFNSRYNGPNASISRIILRSRFDF